MQTTPKPQEISGCTCTVEQELARLGARIDKLIARAARAKEAVQAKVDSLNDKGKTVAKRGEAAFSELKSGMDKAWSDLNQTWFDLKIGTERAVQQLKPDVSGAETEPHPAVPCGCPRHQLETEEDKLDLIV